jgi:hypothetical protein
MSTNSFQSACDTYRYLRNKGYPEKASLKLIADAHRLSKLERNCMFMGIVADDTASRRRRKVLSSVAGKPLAIDWYNVLITVESYLGGRCVFLADDGVIRDASAAHGSFRVTDITTQAMASIAGELELLMPVRIDAWLDAPIAYSGLMAHELRGRFLALPFPASVELAQSADYPLKTYPGVLATSDSVLLDSAQEVFDLARCVLERRYNFIPRPILDLFPPSSEAPPR